MSKKNEHLEPELPDLKWWGEQKFELNQSKAWQFGSMLLRLTRGLQEWRLEYYRPMMQFDYEQQWSCIQDVHFAFPQPVHVKRFMFRETHNTFQLMPRLADRSVVIKPVDPIYIPAGQRGTLYISTPLWMAGFVQSQKEPLFDLPVILPKDTWFGPDKRNGELCYATSVDGRTELNLLRPRAFRAVTPIDFHNISNHQLRFDKMNIPVPALPLFYSESTGRLWTSQIKVIHEDSNKPPRIRIENRTPPLAGEVTYVHPPRTPGGMLFNMFDSFF
ncbi:hypothetical protein [Acinetobacter stercoris]|uniref:DUF432 domain-containing protein n=1 Tax=Acinetobacter stercoris TaxID=2126983 RepID=A0A2U3MZ33_9GAMM|nr:MULTISPECIES: hypothetical protein [Acinetobacter]SPL70634.1 hypothetical protein KPC_1812 [Acinetobacter stercoris]